MTALLEVLDRAYKKDDQYRHKRPQGMEMQRFLNEFRQKEMAANTVSWETIKGFWKLDAANLGDNIKMMILTSATNGEVSISSDNIEAAMKKNSRKRFLN